MQASFNTMYILLERGSEDKALLKDIYKVIIYLGIANEDEFLREYPMLHELRLALTSEIQADNEPFKQN